MTADWIEAMRRVPVRDIAQSRGIPVVRRTIARCPACDSTRPTERNGKLVRHGASGVGTHESGLGWRCFKCDASGDQIDFLSLSLTGRRLRHCSDSQRDEVRAWCQRYLGHASSTQPARVERPPSSPAATEDAPLRRPPADELRKLWSSTLRVDEVPVVASFLRDLRNIDPTTVADRGLARAIGPHTWLPRWACRDGIDWRESGHLIAVPLYDALGEARSVMVVCVIVDAGDLPKSLPPSGYQRKGLVMACPLARRMLRYGTHPSQWPVEPSGTPLDLDEPWWPSEERLRPVICEGPKDYWCWATEHGDAESHPPAVIAIDSGSWTQEIADRVPAGAQVTIATDLNDHSGAGDKYARKIVDTFAGRSDLGIRRWRPPA